MHLRLRSTNIGLFSFLILGILIFLFHIRPYKVPFELLVIMISWAVATELTKSSGALDYMIQVAINVLKRHPHQLSFIGPITSYLVVFLSGVYDINIPIMKTMTEIGKELKLKDSKLERILSTSVISATNAQMTSPVAIVVALLLRANGMNIATIIKALLPVTIIGTLLLILVNPKSKAALHKHLDNIRNKEDHIPQQPHFSHIQVQKITTKISLLLLLACHFFLIWLNAFTPQQLIPSQVDAMHTSTIVFALTILPAAAINLLISKKTYQVTSQRTFQKHMLLMINLMGITWLFNTLFYFVLGSDKLSFHSYIELMLNILYIFYFSIEDQIITLNSISDNLISKKSIAYLGFVAAISTTIMGLLIIELI